MKKILWAVTLLLCLTISAVNAKEPAQQEAISVTQPWVRALPPSQPNTAGYMKIQNHQDQQRILLSAESSAADIVELHQMKRDKGMMTMKRVDQIVIPAKQIVELMPNGYHLMLINLKKPIKKGDAVPMVLHFDQGFTLTVEAVAGDSATSSCCLLKKEK